MHLTNVSLTTMRTKQPFSMIAIMQNTQESQLMGVKVNTMKTRNVRVNGNFS